MLAIKLGVTSMFWEIKNEMYLTLTNYKSENWSKLSKEWIFKKTQFLLEKHELHSMNLQRPIIMLGY